MIKQRLQKGLRGRCVRGLGMLVAALSLCSVVLLGTAAPALAYEKTEATIPVQVTLAGDTAETSPEFTFTAVGQDAASTAALADGTVTLTGAGNTGFTVTADEPSEYHYVVTQTAGDAANWAYDTRIYQVGVYFENSNPDKPDGKLTPKVYVYEVTSEGKKVTGGLGYPCAFTNTYTAPAAEPAQNNSTTPTTPAAQTTQKSVAGMPKTGDTFTYAWIGVAVVAAILIFCGWRLRSKKGESK
ncbi:MAG: Spy0128 family protein [Atopobiaceae bacterium]